MRCVPSVAVYAVTGLGRANAVKMKTLRATLRRQQWDQGKENGLEDSQDTDDVRCDWLTVVLLMAYILQFGYLSGFP